MAIIDKLINNPDGGSRLRSPLVMGAVGAGILIATCYDIATDSMRLSKGGSGKYIHFSEQPIVFSLAILLSLVIAGILLHEARERYKRNCD